MWFPQTRKGGKGIQDRSNMSVERHEVLKEEQVVQCAQNDKSWDKYLKLS